MGTARDRTQERSQSWHDDRAQGPKGLALETVFVPPTRQGRDRLADALRLLAAWALRAARAGALESDPDPSPQPGGAEQQHDATQEADQ